MDNQMKIFSNSDFGEVRTVTMDNEPWFVGKDVAEILGYSDTSDALKRHVDDEDKLTRGITDSGQSRNMYIINESGLYSLVLSSKMPSAKKFKRWVTTEILPSIRKTGFYMPDASALSPELKLMNAIVQQMNQDALSRLRLEGEMREAKEEIQEIREVVEIKPFENWRDDTNKMINKICRKTGDYQDTRKKIYEALDRRAGTKVNQRLDNMRARAILAGTSRSKADSLGILDVIAEDKKLIEIYTAIVKEMAIKKGVS